MDDQAEPKRTAADMVAELVLMGVTQPSISALELRALVKLLIEIKVFSQEEWGPAQEAEFAAVLDFAHKERTKGLLGIN